MKDKTILVIGGDMRQIYLAGSFAENNRVYVCGFDNAVCEESNVKFINGAYTGERVDYIILPLPVSEDGVMVWAPFSKQTFALDSLPKHLKKGGLIFGGRINAQIREIFAARGAESFDYFEREELNVMNSVPTAEGAVQLAMEELPTTVFGTKTLIVGNGRITRALIPILKGMGASVCVAARKYSSLSWARASGCDAIHIKDLGGNISRFSLIINTVPAVVLNEALLSEITDNALVIDLASKPGGVDFEAAGRQGIKTIWALSIPGRVAPVSSGEIIAVTIENILAERGEEQ